MAGNALTTTIINQQAANDAAYLRGVYDTLKRRYQEWNQNAGSTAVLEAAPYNFAAADANEIVSLIGDMNRLIQVFEGTNPGSFTDMRFDCAALMGLA